jgi:hypothetical protein
VNCPPDRTRDPTGKVAECVGMRGRRANPRSAPGRRGRSVGRRKVAAAQGEFRLPEGSRQQLGLLSA